MEGLKPPAWEVAEVQGPYGPVTISERVVQRIWLEQAFGTDDLRTESGRRLRVLSPGVWNRAEGPDFRQASLEIDGAVCTGDVEIHFYPDGWQAHGHERDPAFADVLLHVVLFRNRRAKPARTLSGREPETLALLGYLERDIEELAAEQSLLALERRDDLEPVEALAGYPQYQRRELLRQQARLRWQHKRGYAARRLERDGWENVCHQMCLEVLGYRRNRATMSALAMRHPLHEWPKLNPGALLNERRGEWKLAGLRPANHPGRRLEQYATLCRERPDWPERWRHLMQGRQAPDPRSPEPTGAARKALRLATLRKAIDDGITVGTIGGTRLDTLVVDALLPLAAAAFGRDFFALWFHWYVGDLPDGLRTFTKQTGVAAPPQWPYSNGLMQGALQWLM